jgi:hypothetical protein
MTIMVVSGLVGWVRRTMMLELEAWRVYRADELDVKEMIS